MNELKDWADLMNGDTYIEIQELLDYLAGPDYAEAVPVKRKHVDLLRRLAYKAPNLKRDAVISFLRNILADREARNEYEEKNN